MMLDEDIHLSEFRQKFWTSDNEFVREASYILIECRG
jgi:hypothetical protein